MVLVEVCELEFIVYGLFHHKLSTICSHWAVKFQCSLFSVTCQLRPLLIVHSSIMSVVLWMEKSLILQIIFFFEQFHVVAIKKKELFSVFVMGTQKSVDFRLDA